MYRKRTPWVGQTACRAATSKVPRIRHLATAITSTSPQTVVCGLVTANSLPDHMKSAIAYYRVSTPRQGRSGLGIEAQRSTVARFAEAESMTLVAEFVEVETGKGADALDRRPQLAAALEAARKAKCPVIVAKLDRLSRDVAFISGLMAQRVPFIVAGIAEALNARGLRSARGGKWHVSGVQSVLARYRKTFFRRELWRPPKHGMCACLLSSARTEAAGQVKKVSVARPSSGGATTEGRLASAQ